MFRYGAMHAEYYRHLFCRTIRPAHGALHALNAHIGPVNHLRIMTGWYHGKAPTETLGGCCKPSSFCTSHDEGPMPRHVR